MMISSDGKTTYTDAESLSDDLGVRVRNGDNVALQRLQEISADEDPKQNHSRARALYELAEVYFNGFCGEDRSSEEALKFLTQAAALNDDLALIRLGEFYRDGAQYFTQDGQKALELFVKASERGNQSGLKIAAEMFRYGKGGFAPDGYKAVEFYEMLDALDDKQAPFDIAEIYSEGCGRLKADKQKALAIYDDIVRHGKYWLDVYGDFDIDSPRLGDYKKARYRMTELTAAET